MMAYSREMLTPKRFVWASLRHHRRIHLAVALGVAAATSVLTGALLVGDSVRGSLRSMALHRLGGIDEVLVSNNFFRAELADELQAKLGALEGSTQALPMLVLQGSVEAPSNKTRSAGVALYGFSPGFLPEIEPHHDEVILNQPLADELGLSAEVVDAGKQNGKPVQVILRLPMPSDVPPESPLGKKQTQDIVKGSGLLTVTRIIPATGLGAFSLRPNQQAPKNAFVSLKLLQDRLLPREQRNKPGNVNAIFVAGKVDVDKPGVIEQLRSRHEVLTKLPAPKLVDYGLKWTKVEPQGYFNLTSDRMLLDPALEQAAMAAYADFTPQPIFTYLAHTIALYDDTTAAKAATRSDDGAHETATEESKTVAEIVRDEFDDPWEVALEKALDKKIPYSTVAALDMSAAAPLGQFRTPDGTPIEKIEDGKIVLSRWAADDLGAKPGMRVLVTYLKPESTHGTAVYAAKVLEIQAIVDLKDKDDPFLSPELTPTLPGVTDKLKLSQWEAPFPYDNLRVREQDEDYWDEHRATPKAFVSQATGRELWSSRFGEVTSLRVAPRPGMTVESLEAMFQPDPTSVGFAFQPIKLKALEAATGTTPFEGLFLGFSFFIIAAAVMLTSLLFRLGVEQRAAELGVLSAVGWERRRIARLLLVEGAVVAAVGAALGIALGVGYAWLMLAGLRTLWVDAITVPFLELFVTPGSLATGFVAGLLVSLGTIWWAVRSLRKMPVRRLLANQAAESDLPPAARSSTASAIVQWGAVVLAALAAAAAFKFKDEAQIGAFFGSAACVLTALLAFVKRRLATARFGSMVSAGAGREAMLAIRNAGRNPGRSTLTIGLVAAAAFLIVGVSAFRLATPKDYADRSSGTGGFALVAQTDLPILYDLNTADGRTDLNFSEEQKKSLAETVAFPFRVRAGDDSSCLNLYQTEQPRVLGATDALIERGGFSWADSTASDEATQANPWLLLVQRVSGKFKLPPETVPVVLDQATAKYGLHLIGVGAVFTVADARGREVPCCVVGLLRNSVLQGSVVMHERDFKRHFPEVSGYRFFLIEAPAGQIEGVQRSLENGLSEFGLDAQPSERILADFLAVQNTYLSTFQSLGGLGLLLGTFGLAVVQLRSVLERRSELALLRAVGLSRGFLARLVFWENLALLVGGLGCGVLAAAAAVLPHAVLGGASIPWLWLGATLGAVLVVGLGTGAVVVRAVLRMPLLASLRGD